MATRLILGCYNELTLMQLQNSKSTCRKGTPIGKWHQHDMLLTVTKFFLINRSEMLKSAMRVLTSSCIR